MGDILPNKEGAQPVIFVNQLGQDVRTLQQICKPDSAQPIILVNKTGTNI